MRIRLPLFALLGFAAGLFIDSRQEPKPDALEQTAANLWRRGDRLEALVLLIAVLLDRLPALRPMVARLLVIPAGLLDVSAIESRDTFNSWLAQVRLWLGITPPPIVGLAQGVNPPCGCHDQPAPGDAAGDERPGSSIADVDAPKTPRPADVLGAMIATLKQRNEKLRAANEVLTAADQALRDGKRVRPADIIEQLGDLGPLAALFLGPRSDADASEPAPTEADAAPAEGATPEGPEINASA